MCTVGGQITAKLLPVTPPVFVDVPAMPVSDTGDEHNENTKNTDKKENLKKKKTFPKKTTGTPEKKRLKKKIIPKRIQRKRFLKRKRKNMILHCVRMKTVRKPEIVRIYRQKALSRQKGLLQNSGVTAVQRKRLMTNLPIYVCRNTKYHRAIRLTI